MVVIQDDPKSPSDSQLKKRKDLKGLQTGLLSWKEVSVSVEGF